MKYNKYTVLRVIFAVAGIVCIIASMLHEGEHNRFLPMGLLAVNTANLFCVKGCKN